jgi:hypothetical protein
VRARRIVAVTACLALTGAAGCSPEAKPKPSPGGTVIVFTVDGAPPADGKPTADLLAKRLEALQFGRPTVRQIDPGTFEARLPGKHSGVAYADVPKPLTFTIRAVLDQSMWDDEHDPVPTGGPTTLDAVRKKVGARRFDAIPATIADAQWLDGPQPLGLGGLTGTEVSLLPLAVQFLAPDVTCAHIAARPQIPAPLGEAVVCGPGGHLKYRVGPAFITNADVVDAGFDHDQFGWSVDVHFTRDAGQRWRDISREAAQQTDVSPCGNAFSDGRCPIAMLLDQSAECVALILSELPSGQTDITRDLTQARAYTQDEVRVIAARLSSAGLPVTLTLKDVRVEE